MDVRTMMMLWPLLKPLLRSKFGLLIIGAGVATYVMGYNPLALLGMGGRSFKTLDARAKN